MSTLTEQWERAAKIGYDVDTMSTPGKPYIKLLGKGFDKAYRAEVNLICGEGDTPEEAIDQALNNAEWWH